ncbi:MAG TPA: hypothetical protein DDW50_19745 [Firmicutes bacterium]|jgi:PAS domain S-box-containing protein|nr:hypothetical protein [Bacillota bacterium]
MAMEIPVDKQNHERNKNMAGNLKKQSPDCQENIEQLVSERTAHLNEVIKQLRAELEAYKAQETSNPGKNPDPNNILSDHHISHKALTESALSHSQLEVIFAAFNDVVILYDTEMNVYQANQPFYGNYGFDPTGLNVKEIIDRVRSRWLDGVTRSFMEQPTSRALQGERVTGLRFIVRKSNGSEVIVESSSGPVKIGEKIVGSLTVWHEIRELTGAERDLLAHKESLEIAEKESEQRYQDLFRKSPGAIILYDGISILEVNPAVGGLLGYRKAEELIGGKFLDVIAPEYREWVSSRIPLILNEDSVSSLKKIDLVGKAGNLIHVEAVGGVCYYHGQKVIQVIFHDITGLKNLETELRNQSAALSHAVVTLETILDTIPIGVIVAESEDGKITYCSSAAKEILDISAFGIVKDLVPGEQRRIKMLHPDRSEISPQEWPLAKALRNGKTIENEETIIQHEDGWEMATVISCTPLRDNNGQILGTVASIVNISKRRQMESALRESEERFRVLAEALPQLMWITDATGKFTYLNRQFYHYTGIPINQLIKQDWTQNIYQDDQEKRMEVWRESFRTGNPYQMEYRIRRHDGEYRWFLGRGLPMRDQQNNISYWFGTCTDIHYQKQLELELQETNSRLHKLNQQMVTTLEEERRMISRELHDEAGQALTALKMYLELILKGLPSDTSIIGQGITEAVKLTDQTLKEIRRLAQDLRPPALDALGLNVTLEDFCYEFSKRVGLGIQYRGCELSPLTDAVRISLYRFLQEALTNVVKYAQSDLVRVRLGSCRQRIFLVVKDNGIGFELNPEVLKGKSMGLIGMEERLSILGGVLRVHSRPGFGTCLTAMIPGRRLE